MKYVKSYKMKKNSYQKKYSNSLNYMKMKTIK